MLRRPVRGAVNPRAGAVKPQPIGNIQRNTVVRPTDPAYVLPGPKTAPQGIASAGASPGGGSMPRPALMAKGGKVATKKPVGLYANINAKRKRIAEGSGEKMRKPGSKGAPTAKAFRESAKTAKKGKK